MSADPSTRFFNSAPQERVDLGTTRVACRSCGSGPDLLLVHGFPLSGFTWRKLLPELSRHFRCHVPDMPGLGEAGWNERTDFSWMGQAATLKALVDHLGLERYHVIAQDTGGTFARCLASIDAQRLQRLVLINTEMPGHRPPWIPFYQAIIGLPGVLSVFRGLLGSRTFLRSPLGFGGCFFDMTLLEGDFHAAFVQPLLDSAPRREGMRRYLASLRDWNLVDRLPELHHRLTQPVLLVWGADDPTFPIEHARRMATQFRNGRLEAVAGAKLLVQEEKPDAVLAAAVPFLTG